MATFLSVDASTNSFAFAFFDTELRQYGKINFYGDKIEERCGDATRKIAALMKVENPQYVIIEATIFTNSPQTAIELSLAQGAIIGAAIMAGVRSVHRVAPITWQSGIGNPLLKKAEKDMIRAENPGRKPTWYKNKEREFRKKRTVAIVNKRFGCTIDDYDVADAVGIGLYSLNNWMKVRNASTKS